MRQLLVTLAFIASLFVSKAAAAHPVDSLYRFSFIPHRDAFHLSHKENDTELHRLLALIEQHREEILSGRIPVRVEGFCPDRRMARQRSNRVKTELIVRGSLREACFHTTNYAQPGDSVVVWLVLPRPCPASAAPDAPPPATTPPATPADTTPALPAAPPAALPTGENSAAPAGLRPTYPALVVRANLLRWATLTPNLGVELRPCRSLGILAQGSYADWGWKDKQRRYKLWSIAPEVRYYLPTRHTWFVGAIYQLGEFHYKLGTTGRAGSYHGGGITGGYSLPLLPRLALDFHAALGYTRATYDSYTRIDGVNVRTNKTGKRVKNYWGINQLGISLSYEFKL